MYDHSDYAPYSAQEVAVVLGIEDDEDLEACYIARDLLMGMTKFTAREIVKLARNRGLSVRELTRVDPSFFRYGNKVFNARMEIAYRLLTVTHSAEFASEMCDLPVGDVLKLSSWV